MNTLGIALVLGLLCLWPVVAGAGKAKKLNPYTGQVDAIQEGKALYDRYGCADCHRTERGAGGGGRGLPVVDDEWEFSSDDETLFKVIRGDYRGKPCQRRPAKTCLRKRSEYARLHRLSLPGGPQQDHLVGPSGDKGAGVPLAQR